MGVLIQLVFLCTIKQVLNAVEYEDDFPDELEARPPSESAFYKHFKECGVPLDVSDGSVPSWYRKKRSIKNKTSTRSEKRGGGGQDYIMQPDHPDTPTRYPWAGRLHEDLSQWYSTSYNWFFKCTVTLITNRIALTYAGCFSRIYDIKDIEYGKTYEKADYDIRKYRMVWGFCDEKRGQNYKLDEQNYIMYTAPTVRSDDKCVMRPLQRLVIPAKINNEIPHGLAMLVFANINYRWFVRPACLPVHGTPLSATLTIAGYGIADAFKTQESNPLFTHNIQQIQDLSLNSTGVLTPTNKDCVPNKDCKGYGDTYGDKSSYFNFYWKSGLEKRVGCLKDEGSPLMWQHEGRFYLMGIYTHHLKFREGTDLGTNCLYAVTYKDEETGLAVRVSNFMDSILHQVLSINAFPDKALCLHPWCKYKKGTIRRTWMVMIYGVPDMPVEYQLVPPCARWIGNTMADVAVCPINIGTQEGNGSWVHTNWLRSNYLIHATEEDDYSDQRLQNNGKARCKPCKGDQDTTGWNAYLWLDEITLGSFSRPPYEGHKPEGIRRSETDAVLEDIAKHGIL